MAEVHPQPMTSLFTEYANATHEPILTSNLNPEPSPPFTFPLQSESSARDASSASRADTDASRPRRAAERSRPQRLSLNALPAFDFNPSSSSDTTSSSPGRSPGRTSPFLIHPTSGHRRNGSEFIGGDGRKGRIGSTMSTSPTMAAQILSPANASGAGPPASRRGHTHRRSGAVSSHDLSNIIKPPLEPRGSSLPATPSNPDHTSTSPVPKDGSFHAVVSTDDKVPLPAASEDATGVEDAQPRARVGFSETIEFIPRPLSTISSDTSSSMSTIRASHSVTGSITSLVGSGTSSPPHNRLRRSSVDMLGDQEDIRARSKPSGSSISGHPLETVTTHDELNGQRPKSASEHRDHCSIDEQSTLHSPIDRPISSEGVPPGEISEDCLDYFEHGSDKMCENMPTRRKRVPAVLTRPRSEPTVTKRSGKVRSWADSLLSRKSGSTSPVDLECDPTHTSTPVRAFAPAGDLTMENVSFDDDTSCVIRNPLHMPPLPQQTQTHQAKVHLHDDKSGLVDDTKMMLDLDAALDSHPGDLPDGTPFTPKRPMHSSGVTGGFTGPGMHYHRRAESAPEMAPIDYHTFGFPRFSSNPRMADVFEEDEEEEQEDNRFKHDAQDSRVRQRSENMAEDGKTAGLGVTIVDAEHLKNEALRTRRSRRTASSASSAENPKSERHTKQEFVVAPPFDEQPGQNQGGVEIVEAEEEPRAVSPTKLSNDSSQTPTLSNTSLFSRSMSAPMMNVLVPASSLTYTTPETLSSTISSPDISRTSFDAPRLHTATSSITDRITLNSCRVGDHNLNLRGSVDDVPSLTSSASTMISAQPPRMSTSAFTNSSAERSSSLSAAVTQSSPLVRPATAGKRSSLASLSRLVGSSYGEKSKLNIEDNATLDNTKNMRKKGNRMSRLMRFWKSKAS